VITTKSGIIAAGSPNTGQTSDAVRGFTVTDGVIWLHESAGGTQQRVLPGLFRELHARLGVCVVEREVADNHRYGEGEHEETAHRAHRADNVAKRCLGIQVAVT